VAFTPSTRGVDNATIVPPASSGGLGPSSRGVTSVTIDPLTAPGRSRSARGVANASIISVGGGVTLPDGWVTITIQQRNGSSWHPITVKQGADTVTVIQFQGVAGPPDPPSPGAAPSLRGVANARIIGTARKPKVGVTGTNESTFNTINTQVGGVTSRRTYSTTLPSSFSTSPFVSDVAANRDTYWSWKPNVASFPTDTAAKNAFSAFLDTIPAGHKTVVMAWHEPEQEIQSGQYTLAQWGALQNAVATIVKGKGRPELRTGFCIMGPWTFDSRSSYSTWDWDNAVNWALIDVVGIDPYITTDPNAMSLQTLLTVRNSGSATGTSATLSTMARLQTWGKPVSIMEYGSVTGEAQSATFITQGYAWMKTWNTQHPELPIESSIWFNIWPSGGLNTLMTGAEITAYAATVADSKV
jgi:hypothetical protein